MGAEPLDETHDRIGEELPVTELEAVAHLLINAAANLRAIRRMH